jgi:hypothetical protein
VIDVLKAIGFWLVVGAPLVITALAFLDAARRPAWAWALAERRQALWMALIGGSAITFVGGLFMAAIYAIVARPAVRDAENGIFEWPGDVDE